ncbi:hypothetical protein LSH36_500g03043 [Paralvinella palmiformis]|uniref:UspA domain-containing protein n=1 Tax=Paralvinella palmiformis TaxID=53620 RepID=A0AAD9J9Y7_9ANNE|nr:hypothetical protein LSH36_500g03043 [Paralvinella palmiformis]
MKVLVAVDGSEHADQAIRWYLGQHQPDNEVVLVYVVEYPISPGYTYGVGMALPQTQWDAMVKNANEEALATRERVQQLMADVPHKYIRRYGQPGQTLCDVAKEENVDMVVVGTRGRGKIRRTLLGSVSDYVLHHSQVPVAICRQ